MTRPQLLTRRRRLVLVLTLTVARFACAVPMLRAQAVSTLKVETHLIETTFTVRDPQNRPVGDLKASDFVLNEDGVPQTIRYFATERERPLSIGLLIDASGSQEKFTKEHQQEVEAFLQQMLTPADRAFAVCFGNHLRLVSDWTSNAAGLLDSVHRFQKGERSFPEIGPKEERDLGTALNDAVYFSIEQKMAKEAGRRRVLILFTDGQENSSEHDEIDALEEAEGADVLVYAIRTTEHTEGKWTARDRYGERVLRHLTSGTGATQFDARSMSATDAFAAIAADLRSLYEVGYYSTNTVRDGRFRKVTITTKAGEGTVRARGGYVAR